MNISKLILPTKTEDNLRQIYSGKEYLINVRRHKRDKIIIFVSVVTVSVVVSLIMFCREAERTSMPVTSLDRNDYDGGSKTMSLYVKRGTSDDKKKIEVNVNEKKHPENELDALSESIDERLWKEIIGENESLDNVVSDLNLVGSIEGYPFSIKWKSESPSLIDSRGRVNGNKIQEELEGLDFEAGGIAVRLVATLSYKDYCVDKSSYVIVLGRPEAEDDLTFDEAVMKEIEKKDEESVSMDTQLLPEKIFDEPVEFYPTPGYTWTVVLVFGIVSAILLCIVKDRKVDELTQKRQEEMNKDYPVILNRFALYYIAGMNPRSIWELICDRYESESETKRYAYEEMVITNRRMKEGEGEISAYEDFARRCKNVKFRTFISLLEQSVQKGGKGLDTALFEELEKARREETLRIRLKSQEAGTKLLLPMFMMLMIVLVIVLVPAFIGFNS